MILKNPTELKKLKQILQKNLIREQLFSLEINVKSIKHFYIYISNLQEMVQNDDTYFTLFTFTTKDFCVQLL